MRFLYDFFISLYHVALSIAALWNKKAAQWLAGRKNLWTELDQTFSKPHAVIWIHSASAGEFEQAKPLIEALKKTYPACKILVTAFSPSGYPGMKKFALADFVFYLPLDTAKNAERFVATVQPKLVVFVKYDFWYHYLKTVHRHQIPLLLVSSIFRKEQPFFKWQGGFYLSMLRFFSQLFVQDETSYGLLKKAGIENVTIAGDTRFDRVIAIAQNAPPVPFLDAFINGEKTIVAGSTWPDDERLLHGVLKKFTGMKLVVAPHEINDAHINTVAQLFQNALLYSALAAADAVALENKLRDADVLIIDNVGMLSRLYQYATIAYIGGGFTKSGIHNSLEAAVFGKPVLFGPNFKKYREAHELVASGGAFSFSTGAELKNKIVELLDDASNLEKSSRAAAAYVQQNGGATNKVMQYIQEKRLLTS